MLRSLSKIHFLSVIAAALCAMLSPFNPAFAANPMKDALIEFKREGQVISSHSLEALGKMTQARPLKIFESHEKRTRTYQVYSARALFDQTFGKTWRLADELIFFCADGYQPSIPVAKFLAYDAYFAFASADDIPFTLVNKLQNNEVVTLGPLYLVWDNLAARTLLDDGAADMPYQVTGVELTSFAARFPHLYPPADASLSAQRGFQHFRKYCLACHTINGQGGGKAPELNYPVSVTEYIEPQYLKRWIDRPESIRYNTTMPALGIETPRRTEVIEEIIAYLEAMSKLKRSPAAVSN